MMISNGYYSINELKSLFIKSKFCVGDLIESTMKHSDGTYKTLLCKIESKHNDDQYYVYPISLFNGNYSIDYNKKMVDRMLINKDILIKHFKKI